MAFITPVWFIDLILVGIDFLLRLSWANKLPMLGKDPFASVSPFMIGLFGFYAISFAVGMWLARSTLRHVPSEAWRGWNITGALKEERSNLKLPYDLDLLLPVLYRRRTVLARKMSLQGRDTTAAIGFSLVLIIVAAVAIVSFFNGETSGMTSGLVWFTAISFVLAAVCMGYAASSIGRAGKDEKTPPAWQSFVSFLLMAPLIIGLLGVLGAISAGLSLHADQYPPSGLDVVVDIVVRSLFMGVAAWLLVYAPRKIAVLTLKCNVVSSKLFMILLVISYAVWLISDWFLYIYP